MTQKRVAAILETEDYADCANYSGRMEYAGGEVTTEIRQSVWHTN